MDNERQQPPQPQAPAKTQQAKPRPAPPGQQPARQPPAPTTQRDAGQSRARPVETFTPAGQSKVDSKQSPGMQLGEAIVTAGKGGEKNLALEKFWTRVEGPVMGYSCAWPCGFDIRTLPGNGIEVTMEQLSYKKSFSGTGALKTQVIPVAPIGTRGRIVVRDSVTGETVEQPWTWHLVGGSGR